MRRSTEINFYLFQISVLIQDKKSIYNILGVHGLIILNLWVSSYAATAEPFPSHFYLCKIHHGSSSFCIYSSPFHLATAQSL